MLKSMIIVPNTLLYALIARSSHLEYIPLSVLRVLRKPYSTLQSQPSAQ